METRPHDKPVSPLQLAIFIPTIILALVLYRVLHSALDLTEPRRLSTGRIHVLYEMHGERERHSSEYRTGSGWKSHPPVRERYLYLRYKSGWFFSGDFCDEAEELWRELRPKAEALGVAIVRIQRSGSKLWRTDNETLWQKTDSGARWFSTVVELQRTGEAEWAASSFGAPCAFARPREPAPEGAGHGL